MNEDNAYLVIIGLSGAILLGILWYLMSGQEVDRLELKRDWTPPTEQQMLWVPLMRDSR